jgi:hypothetical protein
MSESLNIPERYTKEDASPEDKQIYEYYKKIIHNLQESAKKERGEVFMVQNGFKVVIWQEPEDEYLERVKAFE